MSSLAQDLAWIGEYLAWFFLVQLGILWLILPIVVISIRRHLDKTAERQQRVIDELLLLRGSMQSLLGTDSILQSQTVAASDANVRVNALRLDKERFGKDQGPEEKGKANMPVQSQSGGGEKTRQEPPPLRAEETGKKSDTDKPKARSKSIEKGSGQPFLDRMLGSAASTSNSTDGLDEPIPVVSSAPPDDEAPEDGTLPEHNVTPMGTVREQAATSIQFNAYAPENGQSAKPDAGLDAAFDADTAYDEDFDEDEDDIGPDSVAEIISRAAPKANTKMPADIVQDEDGCYIYRGKRYTRKADAERQQRIDMRP